MEGIGTHQRSFKWYHPGPARPPLPQDWGFATPTKTPIAIISAWAYPQEGTGERRQGCRGPCMQLHGDWISIRIPIPYPQKNLCKSHRIPIPSELLNPPFCTPHPAFLQRVSIACYAERCISYRKSVRLFVRLSHAGTV